jgi:type I restriction enzyme M protein
VLANPPFGTKKGGERPTRSDFTYPTSNKQLNFLQHIYRSLKPGGRAAVVLPDNVLFQDGDGQKVRADLMSKCDLHTILRLPTGIFYAAGVKTNVLFFRRGTTDKGNTKRVWYYDLRTNMDSFGKRTPFTRAHFADFERAYRADDRAAHTDERWTSFTRPEIEQRGDTLDLGLMADASLTGAADPLDPKELAAEAIDELEVVVDELKELLRLLEINEK